jgi:CelD/BcsL family acetyltransferase involved in cellulose biosynthesis
MNTLGSDIFVEYVELPAHECLEREWLELEARSDASFFISWSWIGCWLSCLPQHIQPKLLRATRGREVVALGLLVSRQFRRHRLFPVKGLFLHSTGDPLYDEITIEYNGFLADRALQSVIIPRLYEHLTAMSDDWDELHLDGVTEISGFQLQDLIGLRVQRQQECVNYVDLDEVRAAGGDYLSLLSQNSRYNIRRSIKEYAKQAPITLTAAMSVDEAFEFLAGLKQMHQVYWNSRGFPGAFANVFFESFHNRLISTRFDCGEIQLIRVNIGNRTLGYLYNLIQHGQVSNYQTAFDYTICDKHNRPGLVVHALAIEYNVTLGYSVYDLMAGSYIYKQTLGTSSREMEWIVLQRDRLKFRLEDSLRHLKRLLSGGSSGSEN